MIYILDAFICLLSHHLIRKGVCRFNIDNFALFIPIRKRTDIESNTEHIINLQTTAPLLKCSILPLLITIFMFFVIHGERRNIFVSLRSKWLYDHFD